ncbi:LacI family DNA-binding transcriptional regulator [Bacillus horti]|uniref:LacI family transcriptional regulator n=1 Tax=Caldalkalibacillus horti TaxID=77523 RepID=A0ABT9VVJ5_9BACI|nr:LacI family DNA-binding transcriptional regulator [Bacillus horti]MDQ0164997.1 LacI family transcriptional regulator [Bacillus horti]
MNFTIRDIAKMAGVSPATVSKVMNHYGGVSESTKHKVLSVIEETGYQPIFSAKSLATKKSKLIGLVYAGKINVEFNHPFFNEVLSAFQKTVGMQGYDLIVFSNEQFNKEQENYLARCRHFRVDGCLIIAGEEIEEAVYELDQSEIPCLAVDMELTGPKSSYVMTDNEKISQLVVEHLYLHSIRDIAYIAGTKHSNISNIRLEGFKQAMNKFGLPIKEEWIQYGTFFEDSGYEAMKRILQGDSMPKAVVAGADMMALGALRALREVGLRVPEDVRLIGCDDIEACRYSDPQLTTVKQDKQKIGKLAAYMLNDLINGENDLSSVFVDPELVIRQSCGTKNG